MLQAAEKRFHSIPKIKMAVCKETGLVPCSPRFDFRMNRARHERDISYPKEGRILALCDDVISHRLKMEIPDEKLTCGADAYQMSLADTLLHEKKRH